jgi:hypothetical protein
MDAVQKTTTSELLAPARQTSTATSAAFDLTDYEGQVRITATWSAGGGTSPTLNGKIQSATTSGGSYADVSGATFTQVTDGADSTESILVDTRVANGFIKYVGTIAGTSPTFDGGVVITGEKKVKS